MPLNAALAPAPKGRRTPCLLALDTATERISVALLAGDDEWLADEAGGALASQRVLPMVFELLAGARAAGEGATRPRQRRRGR